MERNEQDDGEPRIFSSIAALRLYWYLVSFSFVYGVTSGSETRRRSPLDTKIGCWQYPWYQSRGAGRSICLDKSDCMKDLLSRKLMEMK